MVVLGRKDILKELREHGASLRKFGVKKISLFGSYARDEQTETSDIDFLVEFEDSRGDYRDSLNLYHFLEDLFGKRLDILEPEHIRLELREEILGGVQYEAEI